MRKLISICVIVLLLVGLATAAMAGNSATTKPASIVPQEVKAAISKAVEDPVLSVSFLCDVWGDPDIQKYLGAYPTLVMKLGKEGGVTFFARGEEHPITIQLPIDGVVLDVPVSIETKSTLRSDKYAEEFISSVKISAFWAAMKTAVAAQTTSLTPPVRTARK